MILFKRFLWGSGLLLLIYLGGIGTQSSSLFIQAMSFIGILIIVFILYMFAKMLFRGLGCLPTLVILVLISLFTMFTMGMFNAGLNDVPHAIARFIGFGGANEQKTTEPVLQKAPENNEIPQQTDDAPSAEAKPASEPVSAELFEETPSEAQNTSNANVQASAKGLLASVVQSLSQEPQPQAQPQAFNPNDYPVVYITPRILSGDTFETGGRYFKLFGIAAPEIGQTCSDANGRAYNCGREAAAWLKDWIIGGELECHVIQQDTKGNMVGTCSYGPYDIGAGLVQAGWAVAYTKYTDAYVPYEELARQNRNGLWQGTFYKPWDWKKLQSRQGNIKVIRKTKKKRFSIFG